MLCSESSSRHLNIAFCTAVLILGCGLPQDDALGRAPVSRGVLLGLQCEGVVVEVEVESGGCEGVYELEKLWKYLMWLINFPVLRIFTQSSHLNLDLSAAVEKSCSLVS